MDNKRTRSGVSFPEKSKFLSHIKGERGWPRTPDLLAKMSALLPKADNDRRLALVREGAYADSCSRQKERLLDRVVGAAEQ